MVEKNFLNLIEDFKKIKGYKLGIFTTYSFDAIFFENILLRKLRQNNPSMKIIVLVDANHYPKTSEMTTLTGIDYLLLPISYTLFHPKIFLFLSEKKSMLYVGSHNLTPSGLTHNLELTYKTQDKSLIWECLEFFKSLFLKVFDKNNPITNTLTELGKTIEHDNNGNFENHLIHNLYSPILQTCLEYLKDETLPITDVLIYAPFFSNVKNLIKKIKQKTNTTQVNLCIQRYNHNLQTKSLSDLPFVFLKEIILKEKRMIHSKFIIFNGKQKFGLVGSPNFTEPALNQIVEKGNIEVALFLRLDNNQKIFNELSFKDISKDEVDKSTRQILQSPPTDIKRKVFILMASVGRLGQLDIRIDAKPEERSLSLVVENLSEKKTFSTIIEPNISHKDIPMRIVGTNTIWFEEKEEIVSNKVRIYNPSGYVSRFAGYTIDSRTVTTMIVNANDFEGIFQIIVALLPEEEHSSTPGKTQVTEPSPGLIHGYSSSGTILDLLFNLLKVPHKKSEKPLDSKIDKNKKGKSDKTTNGTDTSYSMSQTSHEFSELFNKWTRTFSLRKLAKDNSLINYSAYLLISLKLIEIFSKRNLIKSRLIFINKLMTNLLSLTSNHGITPKQEDLLLFVSLVMYLKSETFKSGTSLHHYVIEKKILEELKELEPITFSTQNSSEALKFKDIVMEKLAEVKIPLSTKLSSQSIAALIASITMIKTEQSRLLTSEKLVDAISDVNNDDDAYFLCLILQFLYLIDVVNRNKIKSKIKLIRKSVRLKFFRENLYDDILKTE